LEVEIVIVAVNSGVHNFRNLIPKLNVVDYPYLSSVYSSGEYWWIEEY